MTERRVVATAAEVTPEPAGSTVRTIMLLAFLGFFEFVHNARRRGKALVGALIAALLM